ncbi:hypothetical protein IU501_34455 [Nocardia otitidiscaviarum]|uniref:hypothetical protein n=1 Tax=Nocardia otitidiscaviarum TaxID=1823 RepID=UPI001892E0B7|nr:hypothetical protein [Nocardia otitidiscaviarum]MBF6138072.1 hypothetical protein [Nocardia otitidiscaviarum]
MSVAQAGVIGALAAWAVMNAAISAALWRGLTLVADLYREWTDFLVEWTDLLATEQHRRSTDPAAHALPLGTVAVAEGGDAPAADTDTTGGAS